MEREEIEKREPDVLSMDDFSTTARRDPLCELCPGEVGYHSRAQRTVATAEARYTGRRSEDDPEAAIPTQTLLSGISGM